MLKSFQILVLLLLSSCSATQLIQNKEIEVVVKPIIENVQNVTLNPGKVTYLEFPINLKNGRWFLNCRGTEVPLMVKNQLAMVYLSETYFSNMQSFKCRIDIDDRESESQDIEVLNVSIEEFRYKSERLYVDKKRVTLSKKDQERVMRERELTRKIYQNSASYFLFNSTFIKPLNSYITSHYGTRRLFNNKKKSSHLGNDFRARVGVKIPASNRGRVVFTGDLFYSGKTVILDHGMDIFTMYGHLSKIKVTNGSLVNRGDIVGISGKTGRVSGPHLHWGVKVNGNSVDGISLVVESKKHIKTKLVNNSH